MQHDPTDADPPGWEALSVELPCRLVDRFIAATAGAGPGVEVARATGELKRLRIVLDPAEPGARALERAGRLLRRLDQDPTDCGLRVEWIEDGRWVERYQAGLEPFPLGERFLVDPGGESVEKADSERRVLRLVPGRAFGTGEHPTTRLCAARLERAVQPGSRWVDLGCGSAILGLVAAACGAARVLALDTDAEAVAVAREVVAANRAELLVEVRQGSTDQARGESWDGVVANIESGFFLRQAGALAALLDADRALIVSGLLATDLSSVGGTLEFVGFEILDTATEDEWLSIHARRRGSV